ncbi:hypothetical protein GCM10027320_33730 [Massilia solisilvae]
MDRHVQAERGIVGQVDGNQDQVLLAFVRVDELFEHAQLGSGGRVQRRDARTVPVPPAFLRALAGTIERRFFYRNTPAPHPWNNPPLRSLG